MKTSEAKTTWILQSDLLPAYEIYPLDDYNLYVEKNMAWEYWNWVYEAAEIATKNDVMNYTITHVAVVANRVVGAVFVDGGDFDFKVFAETDEIYNELCKAYFETFHGIDLIGA